MQPLAMALCGMSGCPAVSSFWAIVMPPTSAGSAKQAVGKAKDAVHKATK
jgi:hypothetical protein